MPIKYTDEVEKKETAKPTFAQAMQPEAFTTGVVRGFLGGPGELEKFGAYTVPEMIGLRKPGERDKLFGRETLFPTTEEVGKGMEKVGIERKPGIGETTGEIVGGVGTAVPGLVSGGKALAQRLIQSKPGRLLSGKSSVSRLAPRSTAMARCRATLSCIAML